jgi:hypothetical protein
MALHYARRGKRVVALSGKVPITSNGYKDGTSDARQIAGWFDSRPDANVGILVGPESGLCVLDVDPRHGGDQELARLQQEYGPLPPTWTVETGGGGRHYYFEFDPRAARRELAPGIELKARGGYVVAPPSIHPETARRYSWRSERQLAALPEWMLGSGTRPRMGVSGTPHAIPTGARNDTLTRLAGAMRRHGCGESEILAALHVANSERCAPPLQDSELEALAASVGRYEPAPPSVFSRRPHGAATEPASLRTNSMVSAPQVTPWRPFPVNVFPPGCSRFAREAAAARGLDVAYIGPSMLAALAGAIGNARRLRLKQTYTEPAILWCATVARSGAGKSSGLDDVLRPHREEERRLADENRATHENHCEAVTRHEADRAEFRKARRKDPLAVTPARPEQPPQRALLVEDITVEALAERLRDNPRGVLLARDELSGWIGGFDQYKNARGADVAHWLSMHRASTLTVDRKDRLRPRIHVPRAAVSVLGTIQPRTLARVIRSEHRDNGLLARLFVTMPREAVPRWSDADVSPEAFAAWGMVVGSLLHVLGDERELRLTPEAYERHRAYHDEIAREASAEDDDLFAALSKLRGGALRIALILALARAAERGQASDLKEVDLEAMEGGIALAQWFANEARRVYAALAESPGEHRARVLLDWIESKGGRVAPHELARSGPRQFRGSSEEAEKLLRGLVVAGLAFIVEHPPGPRGGRPGTEFVLARLGAETHESPSEPERSVSAPELGRVEMGGCDSAHQADETTIRDFLSDGGGGRD